MLKIFESENVLYVCTCKAERPITKVYFCRHCLKLRCGECVTHEVDSHYCQNCLEYMTAPEARLKKNKCSNCFECPSCMNTLATRATPHFTETGHSKKLYYQTCGFCRWTSRDIGIPDQTTASGGWQEKENPHSKRISQIMEYYRVLAQKEKLEKERKKITQRCSYLHLSDKYGVSANVVRKLTGMTNTLSKGDIESIQLPLPEASADIEPLPDKFLTEPLIVEEVCSLKQRLSQPQLQPFYCSEMYPQNKYLNIKRSQRCKECEHNLSKPEYNPSSIRFKIQLAAFYHIPELRIRNVSKLYMEKVCRVEVVLINPIPHPVHVTFEEAEELSEEYSAVKMPPCELVLAPRDDTAEFDDTNDDHNFNDDPNVVTFRKWNKIGFIFSVTPSTKDVKVAFKMKHDFINMVVTLPGEQPKEPQIVWLNHLITLQLGKVVGET